MKAMRALGKRLTEIANEYAVILGLKHRVNVVIDEQVTIETGGIAAAMYTGLVHDHHIVRVAPEMVRGSNRGVINISVAHEMIHALQLERDFNDDWHHMDMFARFVNTMRSYEANPFEREAYKKMVPLADARDAVLMASRQGLGLMDHRFMGPTSRIPDWHAPEERRLPSPLLALWAGVGIVWFTALTRLF